MDTTTTYRGYAPGHQGLANAIAAMIGAGSGEILVHRDDEAAARATLAADRIRTLPPGRGGPQRGEFWVAVV